jgi:hypothetical protein
MPSLDPDQIVDVCLSGGWRRTVRVVAVGDAHVDVVPLEGAAALPAGIELWEATIEWRAERGLARVEGVITDATGALRFLETTGGVVMQRRRFFRVRCGVRVTVAGDERDPLLTEAVDVSVGGMLLARADSLSLGDRVRFALTLGEGEILVGGASVVRATPFGHRALAFDALRGNQEQRLGHFVAALQRREAALRAVPGRESRLRER